MEERESNQKAVHVKVYGRVQGVGFRYNTQREAKRRGVRGWVRNDPDGSVEVLCEGDKKRVDQFVSWLSKGPPGAYVTDINKKELPYRNEFRTFSVEF
jgi:acylphosphatase